MKIARNLIFIDLVALFLISMSLIVTTFGFMISSDSLTSSLIKGKNESTIINEFGNYTCLQAGERYENIVVVENQGNVDSYVRVLIEFENPDTADSLNINYNFQNWTEKQDDGYYYYKGILDDGSSTEPLFTNLTPLSDVTDFKMICYSETVQADGFSAVYDAFESIE